MPFDDAGFTERQLRLEMLRAARAGVSARGSWCQGKFMDHRTGARCAVGWLRGDDAFPYRADRAISVANDVLLPLVARAGWLTVEDWNDASHRRRRDVVALFDRAIAALEAEGVKG